MKKNLLIVVLCVIFFNRGYAASDPVPGESLWCITKQIGNTLNSIESSLDILNAAISFNDYLICSQLSVLISILDQMPSIIDPLVSQADIFLSEAEYASSVFDITASKAADISSRIDLLTLCEPHAITASTTINTPGSYCLCNDVGTITIDADDVVFDLRGYTITNGLSVLSHDQVFIENGVIEGAGSANAVTVSSGASNITVSQIIVRNAITGMQFTGVSHGLVEYCEMVSNTTGIALINSHNITIDHGIARSNTQSGFSLVQSFTNYVHDCKAINSGLNNTKVLTNNVYGFVSQNGFSNIFENCIANATQALSTTDYNSIVAGFALTGTEHCSKIIGCEAANAITNASGVTVPYGIYLQPQLDGLISVTSERPGNGATVDEVDSQAWSSDGIYLAVGGNLSGSNKLVLYQFDRLNEQLVQINAATFGNGSIASVAWSPDNRYIVVGGDSATNNLVVYSFDPDNLSLTIAHSLTVSASVNAVSWSPDGQYVAVGLDTSGDNLAIYRFNRVSYALSQVDIKNNATGQAALSVAWSPNGQYVAAGYFNASDTIQLYRFSRATELLTLVDTKNFGSTAAAKSVVWSSDGNYLACAGVFTAITSSILIYRLNIQTNTLQFITSDHQAPEGLSLAWSADNQFLAMGSTGLFSINIAVYRFDRGSGILFLKTSRNFGVQMSALAWSPDGHYLALGAFGGSGDSVRLFSGLSFPSENIIKENVVYCNSGAQFPSGVGINGSSICNIIIQNTAYSNPMNPSIVSSNYQFVCNVYNQLFGTQPSLMQNIALGSCEPIAIQPDVGLILKQAIAQIDLDESMIDRIESAFASIETRLNTVVPACFPQPINQATTITTSGVYCMQNNVSGTIVIASDDVVLDLSGRLLTGSIQIASVDGVTVRNGTIDVNNIANIHGIDVQNGSRNITIEDVLIRNATRAISCNTVAGAIIKNCEMASNITGFEALSSYNISIEASIARANSQSGFSFVSSCTNSVRNTKALDTGLGNTTGANARIFGFFASNGSSNIFEHCIANATQALSTTDYNSVVAGFALAGTENCTKIIHCEAAHATTGINSFSLPYGILLQNQLSGLVTLTLQSTGSISDSVSALSWSSDNRYLIAGGTLSGSDVKIYQFDPATASFVATVTTLDLGSTATVFSAAWSPNNTTFAIGGDLHGADLRIFNFDPTNQTVFQIASVNTGAITDVVRPVAWSPNGIYLAVGGGLTTNDFRIYQYDAVAGTITQVISQSTGAGTDTVRAIQWSPDGQYVAVGGTISGNEVQVYLFTPSPVAVTLAASLNLSSDTVRTLAWSPDGYYLAVGGNVTTNSLRMYRFTRTSTTVATLTAGPATLSGADVYSIAWSADGQMLAVGGQISGADVLIYQFDRANNTLHLLQSASPGGINSDTVQAVAWSPDGRSLAAGGTLTGVDLVLLRALLFPSDNVIMHNTVYCNSGSGPVRGVGMSGSSTCNYIVGNTAYSNPINPIIVNANNRSLFVDTSYAYVCNVYNQLFGTEPTLLQNIALGSNQPIQTQPNIALLLKQTQASLATDISIVDSAVSIMSSVQSKINIFNNPAPCNPTIIVSTVGTTIIASGSYCLANNTIGTIAINASNVVLNLNNHKVTGAITVGAHEGVTIENGMIVNAGSSNGIDVQSGAQNIAIRDVLIRGAVCGIRLQSVDTGVIERCELVRNTTGIEMVSSCNISIDETKAYSNIKSGFSLRTSFTNTIRNSTALSTGENNTQVLTNNVYGFVSQNGFSNIFENCIANATQALSTTDYNSIVAGFALTGTENGTKIIGCEAANAATNASGVTVPYGIYLQPQFDGLISVTSVNSEVVNSIAWSSDGIYLAVGTDVNTVKVYQFNRTFKVLIQLVSFAQTAAVRAVAWSPDGQYLAVGSAAGILTIYNFDKTTQLLKQVDSRDSLATTVTSVSWSQDGQYIALGVGLEGVQVYQFNMVTQTISQVLTSDPNPSLSVVWSSDGNNIATVAGLIIGTVIMYQFDKNTQQLLFIQSVSIPEGPGLNVAWSSDGQYVAICFSVVGAGLGGVKVYHFDKATQMLVSPVTVTGQFDGQSISWSPDGQYLAIGATSVIDKLFVYRFDRGAKTLTQLDFNDPGNSGNTTDAIRTVAWSLDGQYLAVAGTISSTSGDDLFIYRVLSFPYDNVIKDNVVYCNSGAQFPSGVGISGSSICNMIIQNTAYSNPLNPSIVSSNYQFVCNVFNQLFGNAPTGLQNIMLGSCEPIQSPDNVALLIQQAAAGLSFVDQRIVSLQNAFATAPCSPVSITSATTISNAGYYCLASNITGTITISASDVTLDLSGRTITGSISMSGSYITVRNGSFNASGSANAIFAQAGSSILISNVSVRNATRGIAFTNVSNATIEQCHVTLNTTGVELTRCSNVIVDNTLATNNLRSGFSLITSYTNTIMNCQALSTGRNNTAVINNNVYGFVSQNGFSNIFENCVANATQALSTTDYNSIVAGFAFTGTENGTKIIGCEAANAATNASGVTVPYGIYLQPQFDGLISVTSVNTGSGSDIVRTVAWSSDGVYLAVGGTLGSDDVIVYQCNRATQALIKVASVNPDGGYDNENVNTVAWSSDGQYLAVGGAIYGTTSNDVIVYRFDRAAQMLSQIASVNPGGGSNDNIATLSWSPDGQYLAVGGQIDGTSIDDVIVYRFDRVAQTLTQVASVNSGGGSDDGVFALAWSPDGQYLVVGGAINGTPSDDVIVYRFDRGTQILSQVASVNPGGGSYDSVRSLSWSPDGHYLAVGGVISGTLTDDVIVYRFDRGTQTLSQVASVNPGGGSDDNIATLSWSPDGQYLAVGGQIDGTSIDDVIVYRFDRGAQTLSQIASINPGGGASDTILALSWSPDGQYLAVGGQINGTPSNDLILYRVLSFPYDNVIKDNVVYCNSGAQFPSGVGINGSSICNMIIQNTAYSNPNNPSIVSSNYQFVCNVFNQLLQNMPTLMQNISLGSCQAIATPYNLAMLLQQANALVDDLGACGPTAIIPSGLYTISISGNYCLSQDATSDIIISGTCVYLDLSEHCLTGVITVTTSDDVVIANGYVNPAAPADSVSALQAAITILNVAQYTRVNNVVITCADTTTALINGRNAISIAGGNAYISNCTVISGGVASGVAAAATPGDGGDGIAIANTATRAFIRDCVIYNTGSGGTATAGNTGGRAGHGFFVQSGATNTEIINCVVKQTGNGGNTSGAGTGGAGGNGITIQSGAIDTAVNSCTFSNMGSGGTGGTTSGVDGKAVSDAVTTTAHLSIIYKNFAHNILNPTKFDIQALGETGVLSPNPPDATVLNPFANIYTTP